MQHVDVRSSSHWLFGDDKWWCWFRPPNTLRWPKIGVIPQVFFPWCGVSRPIHPLNDTNVNRLSVMVDITFTSTSVTSIYHGLRAGGGGGVWLDGVLCLSSHPVGRAFGSLLLIPHLTVFVLFIWAAWHLNRGCNIVQDKKQIQYSALIIAQVK